MTNKWIDVWKPIFHNKISLVSYHIVNKFAYLQKKNKNTKFVTIKQFVVIIIIITRRNDAELKEHDYLKYTQENISPEEGKKQKGQNLIL